MSRLPASMPDLTASILARTSGPACGRLRVLACDLADGALPPDDRDLARQHLEHCPDCRGLVSHLETIRQVLPAFAQLEPGAEFTASVLRRTRSAPPFPAPPQDRFLAGWVRLMGRPRAALEAAYLATAAGLFLTQVPLPGTQHALGSTLVTLVRTESRAVLARTAAHQPTWIIRTRTSAPRRLLHRQDSRWSTFWSRLAQRIDRAWLDLAKAARALRTRVWHEPPARTPHATEPADVPSRPAP